MKPSRSLRDFEKTRFLLQERKGEHGALRTSALGIIQRFDVLNGNGRIYPKGIFERLLKKDSTFMERVHNRGVLGHVEHPSDGLPDLRKAAVVLTDIGYTKDFPGLREALADAGEKDPDSCVIGKFEALSTPDGRIVEALWCDEVQVGASSRAQGSVIKNEATEYPNYPKGADIVQEDIDEETLTWDIVARPSTPGAFPKRVQEAIMEAQEYYRNENKSQVINPPIGVGGSQMNLQEIRTRMSRIKPMMENLSRSPRSSLVNYMNEINSLYESLEGSSRNLTESQQLPVADMRGELQSLRDRVMSAIGEAFNEASSSDRMQGATSLKVSGQGGNLGTTDPAVLNADPYLSGLKPHQQQPGGVSGTPVPQSRVDGEKQGDQSVPGPGIKGGDSKNASHQKDGGVEDHGTVNGDDKVFASDAGQSIGKKKKKGSEGNFESITTDQAHSTEKGKEGQPEMVKDTEEGEGMEVAQAGGKQWKSTGLKAGKEGSEKGDKLQGVANNLNGASTTKKATVEGVTNMPQESLAKLNIDLTNECRALRRDSKYWQERTTRAESLVAETGKQFRTERRIMAMERLIENNPVLNDDKTRKVLETAQNEGHMVQIAEAILGGRVKISNQKERQLAIKLESTGQYSLYIDSKPYERKFDGSTLWEALSRMGISDTQIEASFDRAHRLTEADWQIPADVEQTITGDGTGEALPPIAIVPGEPGQPAQLVTMEPEGTEGGEGEMGAEGGEGAEDEFLAFGALDLGGEEGEEDGSEEEEGGFEFGGGDTEDTEEADTEEETEDEEEEEEVEESKKGKGTKEAAGCNLSKKDKKADKFSKYLESRKVAARKPINESKKKGVAKRVNESLPPKGGKPTRTLPNMGESVKPAKEMSLTERVILAKRAGAKKTLNG